MRHKHGYYEYQVIPQEQGWGYKIFTDNDIYQEIWGTDVYRESDEWFDTPVQAQFAAIGHISLIENGEG